MQEAWKKIEKGKKNQKNKAGLIFVIFQEGFAAALGSGVGAMVPRGVCAFCCSEIWEVAEKAGNVEFGGALPQVWALSCAAISIFNFFV